MEWKGFTYVTDKTSRNSHETKIQSETILKPLLSVFFSFSFVPPVWFFFLAG